MKRIRYIQYPNDMSHLNHYYLKLTKNDNAGVNKLIEETGMTWDKYLGVTCSQRERKHSISIDVEDGYNAVFNEADLPLIEKYLGIKE